ncbi:MAG: aspartyl protease family protein [Cyclobacteriaceae bacterium]|jgi:predicted aspartyl protease
MKWLLVWSLALLNCFPLICQDQVLGYVLPEGKKKVTIPFQFSNNLIIIPVLFNGQIPLKFILDTGVRTTLLTDKTIADILALPFTRRYTVSGPGGEKLISALITNNITLQIPPAVSGKGHSVLVLEEDYLQLKSQIGFEVHGILGYELFSRFIIKVNYEKSELTFIAPETFRKSRSYKAIPMKVEDTKPYVEANCQFPDGSSALLKLMVDTGASHCLLLDPNAGSEIHVPEKNIHGIIGRGLGGDITGKIARLESIQLGEFALKHPIVNFPDPEVYTDSIRGTDIFRHGTIGGEALNRFTVIFDYSSETLYVKKNLNYRSPFPFNMSGLTVEARGPRLRSYVITDVRKDSSGELAGFMKEDKIISIKGILAENFTLTEINQFLNAREGKKLQMEISRDGARLKKRMQLKNDI